MIARRAVQAQEISDIGTSPKTSDYQTAASVSSFATSAPNLKDVGKKGRDVVTCEDGKKGGDAAEGYVHDAVRIKLLVGRK